MLTPLDQSVDVNCTSEICLYRLASPDPNEVSIHRFVGDKGFTYIVMDMDYCEACDHFTQILYQCRYLGRDGLFMHKFKIAGAAFEAYADPSVVDRCFELLKDHYDRDTTKGRLAQVRVLLRTMKGDHRAKENL